MWFIGDVRLKDMFYTLRALKTPKQNPSLENDLHLHQTYNIQHYTFTDVAHMRSDNPVARLINALIDGLNANQ